MVLSMRQSPVTYSTFLAVFLHQDSSILGLYHLISDRTFYRALGSRVAAAFTVASLLLTLAFPTIMSAMTGYVLATEAFVTGKSDRILIPYQDFREVIYVVHDGWRVNGTADHMIFSSNRLSSSLDRPPNSLQRRTEASLHGRSGLSLEYNEHDLRAVARYVNAYGFYGLNTTLNSTQFNGKILDGPPLNISAFFLSKYSLLPGHYWVDPSTNTTPFQDEWNQKLRYENDTYSLREILKGGKCQPVSDRYQWGFSFVQMFITAALLMVWTAGIWTMWLKVHLNSSTTEHGRAPKRWRGMLHLADSIKCDLVAAGIDWRQLTNEQLATAIKKRLKGGNVSFSVNAVNNTNIGIWSHLLKHFKVLKWWTISLTLQLVVFVWAALWALDYPELPEPWWAFFAIWSSLLLLLCLFIRGASIRYLFLHFLLSVAGNSVAQLYWYRRLGFSPFLLLRHLGHHSVPNITYLE
ncbi:hypothetical protein QBC42DRAFT_265169 [Cladorrhinum samala]|uniref:Uncharacterized protein n=1 Tax=Cladorrhinum samala TaxID=585594 RepID=A0AAV9HRW1_9PEZI|nr:hypothetical protein QBC42DRAFT_265169 [Cladorrhinum samala]